MGALSGDFGKLEEWIKSCGSLKNAATRVAYEALPRLEKAVAAEFSSGSDPYGQAWQPKRDGGQPFQGSDARGKLRIRLVSKTDIRVSAAFPMHFHNAGTKSGGKRTKKKIRAKLRGEGYSKAGIKGAIDALEANRGQRLPARPVVPSNDRGIPAPWDQALRESAREVMAEAGATETNG